MYQHFLELEAFFEDHSVCAGVVVTDSLVLERTVYEQRARVQPLPTALQQVSVLTTRSRRHLFLPTSHQRIRTSKSSTCRMSVPTRVLAYSTLTTSELWLLLSACTSSCIFRRSKGTRVASSNSYSLRSASF